MERILIISKALPPTITGSSIVIENLVKGIDKKKVFVVGERILFAKLPSGSDIKHTLYYNTIGLKRYWFGTSLLRKIQIPSGFLILLFYAFFKKPQRIILVYPVAEYLLMGLALSKIYKANYYSYFHNTYLENRRGFKRNIARWLQGRIFNLSKKVFVISDGLASYYKDNYKCVEKFIPLVHSFVESIPNQINCLIGNKIKVAFAGNINASCADAAKILFNLLAKRNDIEFYLFTTTPSSYFTSLGLNPQSITLKQAERDEFIMLLRSCDIMLLPHGFGGTLSSIEYKFIFPTKTIEYLISGKPILYFGPADTYINSYLTKHKCAYVVNSRSPAALEEGINRLITDLSLRERITKNALLAAKEFMQINVIQKLEMEIN